MRDYVTLVFGLPRSGTSCLCQMLTVMGVPILYTKDFPMPANERNIGGYWEYEPVRHLKEENDWVHHAIGSGFKLFVGSERFLPRNVAYRAIVAMRTRDAILASWRALAPNAPNELDSKNLDELLAWIDDQPNWRRLSVQYEDLLANPEREAQRMSDFLDGLDCSQAAAIVNPRLRHF
jgi:hypothetical protein